MTLIKRNFSIIDEKLLRQLDSVQASEDEKGRVFYPCDVTLKNGDKIECVYLIEDKVYSKGASHWPEQNLIDIDNIVKAEDSIHRLPPQVANKIYKGGETAMGGILFELQFNDGSKQSYSTGAKVDFIPLPPGKSRDDISDVKLHTGRIDPNILRGLEYHWSIFSKT